MFVVPPSVHGVLNTSCANWTFCMYAKEYQKPLMGFWAFHTSSCPRQTVYSVLSSLWISLLAAYRGWRDSLLQCGGWYRVCWCKQFFCLFWQNNLNSRSLTVFQPHSDILVIKLAESFICLLLKNARCDSEKSCVVSSQANFYYINHNPKFASKGFKSTTMWYLPTINTSLFKLFPRKSTHTM